MTWRTLIISFFIIFALLSQSRSEDRDLTKDQTFIKENPQFIEMTRLLIAANGFECPRIANLWVKGMSPFGTRFEALCGPKNNNTNVYPSLHYAVYPERMKAVVCKPIGIFSGSCE